MESSQYVMKQLQQITLKLSENILYQLHLLHLLNLHDKNGDMLYWASQMTMTKMMKKTRNRRYKRKRGNHVVNTNVITVHLLAELLM